ncbi:hypothetical protein [Flavobacterium macacae]|uniref:hypothetical protein n=1 Tax=Flavobacterium macacae TaxID=2488993 RepID=UPI001315928C|nr:hypothetical protein [Flavobacterium macacae]
MENYVQLSGNRDQKIFLNKNHIVGLSQATEDVTAIFTVSETFTVKHSIEEVIQLIAG